MANLKKLILKNFRNHTSLELRFGDGINLIVGRNAQGKTNVLESIYLLGMGKSFRAKDLRDIIKWGESDCTVEAELERGSGKNRAFAYLSDTKKSFKLDGKKKRAVTDLGVVLFVPQDITIFRDQPADRRIYINNLLGGLDKTYKSLYREYSRVVSQRNRILRDAQEFGWKGVEKQIEIWNTALIDRGTDVIMKRQRWIKEINEILPETYNYMGGVGKRAEILYNPNVEVEEFEDDKIKRAFTRRLEDRKDLEEIRGVTLVGPHRDDWSAAIEDRDLKYYGSQSQMRVMALSLKVAELKMRRRPNGESPILLLDDVISELDEVSGEKLLSFVNNVGGQVFLTTTDQENVLESLDPDVQVYHLSPGKVKFGRKL